MLGIGFVGDGTVVMVLVDTDWVSTVEAFRLLVFPWFSCCQSASRPCNIKRLCCGVKDSSTSVGM